MWGERRRGASETQGWEISGRSGLSALLVLDGAGDPVSVPMSSRDDDLRFPDSGESVGFPATPALTAAVTGDRIVVRPAAGRRASTRRCPPTGSTTAGVSGAPTPRRRCRPSRRPVRNTSRYSAATSGSASSPCRTGRRTTRTAPRSTTAPPTGSPKPSAGARRRRLRGRRRRRDRGRAAPRPAPGLTGSPAPRRPRRARPRRGGRPRRAVCRPPRHGAGSPVPP
jgi:hypothetical protein